MQESFVQAVTVIVKYVYDDRNGHILRQLIVACIPNGQLPERYNPAMDDTIWLAGRDACLLVRIFKFD